MNTVTVVDARMGRGKTSAAISYMNKNKGSKRFLYITPYLDEVNKICEKCDFDQSDGDESHTKSCELKHLLHQRKNIAATHSLFYLLDEDALSIINENQYTLIIDESIQVITRLNISSADLDLLSTLVAEDQDGLLRWKDKEYEGIFTGYKRLADSGCLMKRDSVLLNVLNPRLLEAFDEIIMMTYLFDGQYQMAYLKYFGIPYNVVGVRAAGGTYDFSDGLDVPPPVDYGQLIHIVDDKRVNQVGGKRNALSKSWFASRSYRDESVKALRNNMKYFFQQMTNSDANTRLWTTFKSSKEKLIEAKTGRFRGNFLQISARATNEYMGRTDLAYMANRFIDPNLTKFFNTNGITVDHELFALSEMLQWIWRSAIRINKEITIYIPSRRMRELLIQWINTNKEGVTLRG